MTAHLQQFTDEPGALEYATMREAARVASVAGMTLNRNEWPQEKISFAASGREAYWKWYAPIVDTFDRLAREISEKRHDDENEERVLELAKEGDEMHTYYASGLRSGRIPHLPVHSGNKYANVLRAWENLRKVMAS